MSGKGDKRRPTQISKEEESLRWELLHAAPERKKEILKRLEKLNDRERSI